MINKVRTVRRDSKLAEVIDFVEKNMGSAAAARLLNRDIKVSRREIMKLANFEKPNLQKIIDAVNDLKITSLKDAINAIEQPRRAVKVVKLDEESAAKK